MALCDDGTIIVTRRDIAGVFVGFDLFERNGAQLVSTCACSFVGAASTIVARPVVRHHDYSWTSRTPLSSSFSSYTPRSLMFSFWRMGWPQRNDQAPKTSLRSSGASADSRAGPPSRRRFRLPLMTFFLRCRSRLMVLLPDAPGRRGAEAGELSQSFARAGSPLAITPRAHPLLQVGSVLSWENRRRITFPACFFGQEADNTDTTFRECWGSRRVLRHG